MSDATYLDEASNAARKMTLWESRGPGDMENAWRRLEARYGVDFGTFWALRYRTPTGLFHDVFERLMAAYHAERERQIRMLQHDSERTKQLAGTTTSAVAAAEALVGKTTARKRTKKARAAA